MSVRLAFEPVGALPHAGRTEWSPDCGGTEFAEIVVLSAVAHGRAVSERVICSLRRGLELVKIAIGQSRQKETGHALHDRSGTSSSLGSRLGKLVYRRRLDTRLARDRDNHDRFPAHQRPPDRLAGRLRSSGLLLAQL